MSRKDELLELIENDTTLIPLVDEMIYLESELDRLRVLPKIKVHPLDPTKQKTTPAARMYKEYLQQYTNILRMIMRTTGTDESDDESPLRKWLNERFDSE